MEASVIYDLLLIDKLIPYRKELEKEEDNFTESDRAKKEALENSLNEEQLEMLKSYLHSLTLREEYINFQVELRALNYGIKIGVQLQKSIKDLYKYFDEVNDYE